MSEAACQLVSASHVCVLDLVDLSSIATTSEKRRGSLSHRFTLSLSLFFPKTPAVFFSFDQAKESRTPNTSRSLERVVVSIVIGLGAARSLVSSRARRLSSLVSRLSAARRTSSLSPFPFPEAEEEEEQEGDGGERERERERGSPERERERELRSSEREMFFFFFLTLLECEIYSTLMSLVCVCSS